MEGIHRSAGDETHFAAEFGAQENLSYNLVDHYTIPTAVSGTFAVGHSHVGHAVVGDAGMTTTLAIT